MGCGIASGHGNHSGMPTVDDVTREPLFKVSNHHVASCGVPTTIDADDAQKYFGYFANEYGEQAVFVFEPKSGEAILRLGDHGWARTHRVVDGDVPGLVLTPSESAWLRACWLASGARRR